MSEKPEDIRLDNQDSKDRDQIDLNREIMGENAGRIQRFLSSDGGGVYAQDEKKKKEEQRATQTMLMYLLQNDAQYAALFHKVEDKIEKAQQAVDSAMMSINHRHEASVEMLQNLRDDAAEMPDGTKVFLSDDGGIYTQDGQRLNDADAQNINIPEGATRWEAYQQEKQKQEILLRQQDEIQTYQRDVLDPAKEQMDNSDTPPSLDELKGIEKQIDIQMPDAVKTNYHNSDLAAESLNNLSVAHTQIDETEITVPDMSAAFDAARLDIPDLGSLPTPEVAPARTPV